MIGTTTVAAPAMTTVAAPTYTYAAAAPTVTAAPAYAASYTAAPTVGTTTIAAPTYAAAPTTQVASYVAPPVATTVAAPMMTTMAAPTYAAPAVTTQTASFVAPPPMVPGIPTPAMPAQPVSLTAGLPTPEQIMQQKAGYGAALDKQLAEAMATVKKETEIEKQMVKFTAEKNIALYNMQVDEALVEQTALADEQATIAHCELRKALVERNLQLNSQAQNMTMDYQMKALVSDCEMKKYQFAQQYMKEEGKLAAQFQQQEIKAHTGTAYAAPAAAVPAK